MRLDTMLLAGLGLAIGGLVSPSHAVTGDVSAGDAMDHIRLSAVYDADCARRHGKRARVQSIDTRRTIEVQLERYFMDVRQAGRSVVVLTPEAEPVLLGCSRVLADEAEQYWQPVRAMYLAP